MYTATIPSGICAGGAAGTDAPPGTGLVVVVVEVVYFWFGLDGRLGFVAACLHCIAMLVGVPGVIAGDGRRALSGGEGSVLVLVATAIAVAAVAVVGKRDLRAEERGGGGE